METNSIRRGSAHILVALLCSVAPLQAQPEAGPERALGAVRVRQAVEGIGAGRVTDSASGQPLAGAQVAVVGTASVALTAADGSYRIAGVPAGTQRVRVTRVGYAPRLQSLVVTSGQTATLNFTLSLQAVAVEGVVAVGYGTQEKRDVTGSIASVREAEIKQIPTPNAIDAIKGRVPGVDIVASGYDPGAGVRVRIRGTRSINAGNDPLYVVDGIPLAGGIQDFNPANVQSIEVLKDASATAVYGARGANGVVLITTGQGRRGATRISYETYAGVQNIINKIPMMNAEEFAEYKREAHRAAGRYRSDQDLFFPVELESLQLGRSTDWQDLILRTGLQQNHQIEASGGDEQTRFSVSANYFDQTGVTRGQDFARRSGGFSLDHLVGQLRFGISATASRSTQNLGRGDGLWAEALQQNPLGVPYDEEGRIQFLPTPDGLRSNPLSDGENWRNEVVRTRVFGSLFSELQLAEGLAWRVNFGPDLIFREQGEFRGSETNVRRLSPADAGRSDESVLAYTLDNILTLNRELGADHDVDATLLYSIQQEHERRQNASVSELPYEHQLFHNLGTAGVIRGVGSRLQEWSLQSYMARLNYGFRDRYLLTLTGRVDGSSRLADGSKYAFFPSVGLAWRLGDEPFLAKSGIFSELKLRASYGRTGNTSIAPYQTQGSLRRTAYLLGDRGAYGYGPNELENPALEWEKTAQFDVGVDFGVLANRISGTVDFYRADTRDLLLERQLPTALGFNSILENVGHTRNTGLELSLSTVNLEDWHGLEWTTDLSWSTNRNEIVSLYGGRQDDVGNRWFIGQPIQVYYDYEFGGIWQLHQAAEAAKYRQKPGEIRVVDQNADGKISDLDRVILGTSYPDWTGSLSSRLAWKSLDLSVLAIARSGATIRDEFGDGYNGLFGRYNNLRVDYWTPTNPSNTMPRAIGGDPAGNNRFSDRWVEDSDFFRLKTLQLGFTLPDNILGTRATGSRI
ncbi:MAG: TonB-dependent receptor, partial [Gemmatimonadetes bacterium]|nr:TonB-dependent receptor [Gemmatimonadota bacterium]